jgi:uncharacterized protein
MPLRDARTGLVLLDREECLEHLARHSVGRLAVVEGDHPMVFPVNYVMAGDEVVFRTAAGSKLTAALRAPVALEIDDLDETSRSGWSVVVKGWAEEITDQHGAAVQALRELPLDPWATSEKPHWLRIVPRAITGRRL